MLSFSTGLYWAMGSFCGNPIFFNERANIEIRSYIPI